MKCASFPTTLADRRYHGALYRGVGFAEAGTAGNKTVTDGEKGRTTGRQNGGIEHAIPLQLAGSGLIATYRVLARSVRGWNLSSDASFEGARCLFTVRVRKYILAQ